MCTLAVQGLGCVQEWCLCSPSPFPHPAESTENTESLFIQPIARGLGGQEILGGGQQARSRHSRRERGAGSGRAGDLLSWLTHSGSNRVLGDTTGITPSVQPEVTLGSQRTLGQGQKAGKGLPCPVPISHSPSHPSWPPRSSSGSSMGWSDDENGLRRPLPASPPPTWSYQNPPAGQHGPHIEGHRWLVWP